MKNTLLLCLTLLCVPVLVQAQCTEAKDADMAKYKRLTETQDAQGCSQCAMLAMYFCSARYCVNPEDKRKVDAMITACKRNIKTMGQPYCCSELVDKEPQWGIGDGAAPSSGSSNNSTSSTSSTSGSGIVPGNATKKTTDNNDPEETINSLMRGLAADPNNPFASNPDLLENFISILQESLGADDDPDSINIFEQVLKQLLDSGVLNVDQVSMIKKMVNNPSAGKP